MKKNQAKVLENLNSEKFENMKKYEIQNLDKIVGGMCDRMTRGENATYDTVDHVKDSPEDYKIA